MSCIVGTVGGYTHDQICTSTFLVWSGVGCALLADGDHRSLILTHTTSNSKFMVGLRFYCAISVLMHAVPDDARPATMHALLSLQPAPGLARRPYGSFRAEMPLLLLETAHKLR